MSTTCLSLSGSLLLPFPNCSKLPPTVAARFKTLSFVRRSVVSTEQPLTTTTTTTNIQADRTPKYEHVETEVERLNVKCYFEQSRELLIKSDGGPPRWFSPLECGSRVNNSPLLLSLPGFDGTGLSLLLHHQRLGEMFDIWCLHIPATDQTLFTDLVKLVERTVHSENSKFPDRPIYLVGESIGGCLALAVAARNPDIDLVLVLANPATSFAKSTLQPLKAILNIIPDQLRLGLPYVLSLITGVPLKMVMSAIEKGLPLQQTVTDLSDAVAALSSYLSSLSDVLTTEMLLWKLKILESACRYANSHLHTVSAQTLVLCSGIDQLFPSLQEGQRLRRILRKCHIRTFEYSGHALFLEEGFDLVTVIKGAGFYRRGKYTDYASDFLPSPVEIKNVIDSFRWLDVAASPVMLSTLESGKIVRGLAGIPSEGPVLFVGCHNMLGFEVVPMMRRFIIERNILLRGIAHPMLFMKSRDGMMPDLAIYDVTRVMGAVPVSASNFYKLLSMKSHVLLYPGGVREALHRKGEEYKLFWPEQSEFVRMAARFGATIVPFGAVGEDDFTQLLLDYDDQMRIPFLKAYIEELTDESVKLRTDIEGEIANQDLYMPAFLPKLPGRYYYFFGKPIKTEGREQELRNRDKAHELYLEVKSEVENCLAYCKVKRESDPYRNIIPRLLYQATNGAESEVPTFDIE